MTTIAPEVFEHCVRAIREGCLIERHSRTDKEFHFQDWFMARLGELKRPFDCGGRNSYPDFCMVEHAEGYELKGLAYPGRDATFDSNSQVPTGKHNGRQIYYVFGRYPKHPDGPTYPVLDLVICHGDFLNADHEYVHKNKNVKGFGSYGDLMIRDRKMYVVPTPFRLIEGVAHTQTLVLPTGQPLPKSYICVGELQRKEASQLVVAYSFDLRMNELVPSCVENPDAGRIHEFRAWRLKNTPGNKVAMRVEDGNASRS